MKPKHKLPCTRQYKLKKVTDILKISAILSLVTIFSAFSNINIYSQTKISVNVENTEIRDIIDLIETTTDLRFFYDNDIYNFTRNNYNFLRIVII